MNNTHGQETIFSIRQSFANFGFDLAIGIKSFSTQKISIMEPATFREYEEGTIATPTINLSHDAAVKLMDELRRVGIRPSDGEGSVGQIGAMKEHLNDMRKLVFKEKA